MEIYACGLYPLVFAAGISARESRDANIPRDIIYKQGVQVLGL